MNVATKFLLLKVPVWGGQIDEIHMPQVVAVKKKCTAEPV